MTKSIKERAPPYTPFLEVADDEILRIRAALEIEMRKRGIALSVGDMGEKLAVEYFKVTPKLPNLQYAPSGTKNVDALSRDGERYSIKTTCKGKKTGTIYPDAEDETKQLFEYLLIVRLSDSWSLDSIHQLSWSKFVTVRSWDKRMKAWYVAISSRVLSDATLIFSAGKADG